MQINDLPKLHQAACDGDVYLITALLDAGARVGETDQSDFTALDYAACFGRTAVAKVLLERGASAFRIARSGHTPLGLAEGRNHFETAELLRKHGAGRTTPVAEWFRLDKSVWSVAKLDDPPDDDAFWRSRSPIERLQGLEHLRRLNYGPAATARLQRVLEVTQRTQR